MKDFNVLWLGRNNDYRVTGQLRYLLTELESRVNVIKYGWAYPTWSTRTTNKDVLIPFKEHKPDVIFVAQYFNWTNLDQIDVPKFFWWSDPQTWAEMRVRWANNSKATVVLPMAYGGRWGVEYLESKLDAKVRLFPNTVDTNVIMDYGLEKIHDILIIGRKGRPIYPLRHEIKLVLETPEITNKYKVKWQSRPRNDYGWTEKRLKERGFVSGASYGKLINQSKVVPFGNSIYRFPMGKIFEIMATNTLAMFDAPYNPEQYHFVDGKNYVDINKHNFKEKLIYYLENEKERLEIARNGYELVEKYHSVKIRIDYLLELMEEEMS
jgi:spore maturation protein CgeB